MHHTSLLSRPTVTIYDMAKSVLTGVIFPNGHCTSCDVQNVLQLLHAYLCLVNCSVIIYFQKKTVKAKENREEKKNKTVIDHHISYGVD